MMSGYKNPDGPQKFKEKGANQLDSQKRKLQNGASADVGSVKNNIMGLSMGASASNVTPAKPRNPSASIFKTTTVPTPKV
jgi:hypothetical protein|tara:strand:- start:7075 stop:7314 length:240 start_codon:yes stop_codon:yes gene_type:complete